MFNFNNVIELNTNSIGIIPTLAVVLLFTIFVTTFSLIFHRTKTMFYIIITEVHMSVILTIFLVIFNASDLTLIVVLTKVAYTVFTLLALHVLYFISSLVNKPMLLAKVFLLTSTFILILLTFSSDTLMIKNKVNYSTYYVTEKGDFYFLYFILAASVLSILLINFVQLYIHNRNRFHEIWPVIVGILFFTGHTILMIIITVYQLPIKLSIYVNPLVFTTFICVYLFKQIKVSIEESDELHSHYLYDELTKVHTRGFILDHLESILNNPFLKHHYIALIDLDNFKRVNDNYGHLFGDDVLRSFGNLLNMNKSFNNQAGRLGGDEFIIIFEHANKTQLMLNLEELIIDYKKLLKGLGVEVDTLELGLSIGLLKLSPFGLLKIALTNVDNAMYQSKKKGKNQLTYFSNNSHKNLQH